MHYFEVQVASIAYRSDEPLTYSSEVILKSGQLVVISIRNKRVLGVVLQPVSKPAFTVKPVAKIINEAILPDWFLPLATWMVQYYPSSLGQTLATFIPSNIMVSSRASKQLAKIKPALKDLPPLTARQKQVTDELRLPSNKSESVFLHGVTGSGKTRVYSERIADTLHLGKSVILLTPEIGLTPQLTETMISAFGSVVTVLHSGLTAQTRRNSWLKILEADQPQVIIGPRSALFSPIKNVGLIIVDEAHDSAYKQDQQPYYQTTRVAAKLRELTGSQLILGSATPDIVDYFTFVSKKLPILTLNETALPATELHTSIIDLKNRSNLTKSNWLSDALLEAIEKSLQNKEQSLVFINRRGSARVVLCANCGWQADCPNCDLPLTFHADHYKLICHTCGHKENAKTTCPSCGGNELEMKSVGTKALVSELQKHFPHARIARFDTDNLTTETLEKQYEHIKSGSIDILVGTQMLSKGLDLPKLTTVGIVHADSALSFPDFTAEERAFQQITQIIGRVSRGHAAGTVILQTYQPDNQVIKAALKRDYLAFYEMQIVERQAFDFPPFKHLLKIEVTKKQDAAALSGAEKIFETIKTSVSGIQLLGPAPAFRFKRDNHYSWQIIIKSPQRSRLLEVIKLLPTSCKYDIDPNHLL